MKNLITYTVALLSFFLLFSCDKDDPIPPDPPVDPIDLNANTHPAQGAEPYDLLTLDGSSSKGPVGFTYAWVYAGDVAESEINFQNKTSVKPTFVPPANGTYSFTLTVAH